MGNKSAIYVNILLKCVQLLHRGETFLLYIWIDPWDGGGKVERWKGGIVE
jgi:hypothetical protein